MFVVLYEDARLAQSVEHETLNLRVVGSSPTLGEFSLETLWQQLTIPQRHVQI